MDFRFLLYFFLPIYSTKSGRTCFSLLKAPDILWNDIYFLTVFAWPFCTCSLACSLDWGHYGIFWGWNCEGVSVHARNGTRLSEKVSRQFATVYVFIMSHSWFILLCHQYPITHRHKNDTQIRVYKTWSPLSSITASLMFRSFCDF